MEVDEPDRDIGTILDTIRQLYQRGLFGEIIRNPRYYLQRYLHNNNKFLFNMEADPNEEDNLINEKSEKVQELQTLLEDWIKEGEELNEQLSQNKDLDIDSETSEQLKQLGYVN